MFKFDSLFANFLDICRKRILLNGIQLVLRTYFEIFHSGRKVLYLLRDIYNRVNSGGQFLPFFYEEFSLLIYYFVNFITEL